MENIRKALRWRCSAEWERIFLLRRDGINGDDRSQGYFDTGQIAECPQSFGKISLAADWRQERIIALHRRSDRGGRTVDSGLESRGRGDFRPRRRDARSLAVDFRSH